MSRRIDKVIIGDHEFETLIAVTFKEFELGLMFKTWPPPIMVFPFSKASYTKFWMKNTPSPLDIIFCKEGSVIDILKGKPFDTTLIGPNLPIDLVVELPFGTASSKGIKIGNVVEVKYSFDTLIKKMKQPR